MYALAGEGGEEREERGEEERGRVLVMSGGTESRHGGLEKRLLTSSSSKLVSPFSIFAPIPLSNELYRS